MTKLQRLSLPGLALLFMVAGVGACDTRSQTADTPEISDLSSKELIDPKLAAAQRLSRIAAAGDGDPHAEAQRAMADKDFRFVGYLFMVPGGWPAAYGVQCEPSIASQRDRVGAVYATSDVVPVTVKEQQDRQDAKANFRRFGAAYNKTLLEDPRFPHRGSCSAVPVGDARERGDPSG